MFASRPPIDGRAAPSRLSLRAAPSAGRPRWTKSIKRAPRLFEYKYVFGLSIVKQVTQRGAAEGAEPRARMQGSKVRFRFLAEPSLRPPMKPNKADARKRSKDRGGFASTFSK